MSELTEYRKKRDFNKTQEPEGKTILNARENLKYLVQHHIARKDHYDLRLEWNGVLLSWALPKGPSYNPKDKRLAIHVEDHPIDYRNFEGTIPKGEYGGGVVMLWDEGWWEPLTEVNKGLNEGVLKFVIHGIRLKGIWALIRLQEKEGKSDNDNWILVKDKDEYAQKDSGITDFNVSIRTRRTMKEIEEDRNQKFIKNPVKAVDVQLAKLVRVPPEGDDWIFEVKYDGYRIIAFIEENTVRLITRNGKDFSHRFKSIQSSLIGMADGRAIILDGEMVVTDSEGKTDFQALQNHIKKSDNDRLVYIVFDILAIDGKDLRQHPLKERKDILDTVVNDSQYCIQTSKYVIGSGKECYIAACKMKLEGIIGKKINSVYSGNRSGDWVKVKCDNRQEFIIGGYTLTDKKTRGISAVLLGVYDNDKLLYAGRAGTGFTQSKANELEKQFKSIITDKCPFFKEPKVNKNEKIIWLKPETVAEIKFSEWTDEKIIRQASFKGLRTDKNPKDIIMEKENNIAEQDIINNTEKRPTNADGDKGEKVQGIKITNPDKVIFTEPKIRKIDIVRYYESVSERMLPYVSERILSIVRCPKGIDEPCFFKKHPDANSKNIFKITVDGSEEYFYIKNAAGLIQEAQMGTLEFHTWGSLVDNIEKPDIMVFDLDPDTGMDLKQIRRGVRDIKEILDGLSLKSYLKTSGGKGYHIVVPLTPYADWDAVRNFSKNVAILMENKWPELYTSNIRKDKRKGKVYIDWVRNGRSATSIAPYSVRARNGASVSMPISWEELDTVKPDSIKMEEALLRISKANPWQDFFKNNQRLK